MTTDLRDNLQTTLGTSYAIDRELGGGGMSRVFIADEQALGRKVVVKVLRPDLAEGISADRFRREILLAASLQQANIVPVLAAGISDGLPFYTMPFVDGESVRARLERERPLPIEDVVNILRDVSRALAYAHERGIVHRDVKPDNILLSGGTAVVTDFGIAKALNAARADAPQATLTSVGTSIGTPAYMAPEQAAGDPEVDHRADLYALGCVAYELLAGQVPFANRSPQRMLGAHMGEIPAPVTDHRPDCPEPLAALVARLLEKEPSMRPQSATEVLQALSAVATATSSGADDATPVISIATRRALVRALGIYAAAFVAVALLAKAAIVGIGLPDWVLPGALVVMGLGLPIILLTALASHGRRVARTGPMATPGGSSVSRSTMTTLAVKASPYLSWRRTTLGGVWAMGAFAAAVAGFMILRALGIGPAGSLFARGVLETRERVVVADFGGAASDSTLRSVVSEAVRTNLAQSRALTIVPSSFVAGALRRMQRPAMSRVDLPLARELAQREGIKAVVDGSVAPLGQGFILTARLVSASTGDELASARDVAKDATDLIPSIDRVTRSLRGHIGESLRSVRATPPLAQVTTSSLEALRQFTTAYRANYLENDFRKAIVAAESAIRLDSSFASAYRLAGLAYGNAGLARAHAESLMQIGYRLRDRLPEQERAQMEASVYGVGGSFASKNRQKELAGWLRAIELDPTNSGALLNAAMQRFSQRQYASAESLYTRAIAVGDNATAYELLASTLAAEQKFDSARALIALFQKRYPANQRAIRAPASLYSARGDIDSAAGVCRRLTAVSDSGARSGGYRCLAIAAEIHGQLREREEQFRRSDAVDSARGAPVSKRVIALDHAYVEAWIEERPDRALRILDSMVTVGEPPATAPNSFIRMATYYALAGRPDRGRQILARYDTEVRDTVARRLAWREWHLALGSLALAEGKFPEAIGEYHQVERDPDGGPDFCEQCAYGPLARAFDLAGQRDSAIAYFERFFASPFPYRWNGGNDAQFRAGAFKRLGELYEAKGDRVRAAANYQKFVDLWKNADPELQPKVAEVKQRLARLTDLEPRR